MVLPLPRGISITVANTKRHIVNDLICGKLVRAVHFRTPPCSNEQKGRLPEAVETFKRGLALEGNTELWSGLGHAYAVSGQRADTQEILDHLKELSMHRYVAPYNFALIYAGLEQKDEAFNWLNRAYDARSYMLVVYLNTDTRLDILRSDPRFDELRRRIALPAPR
jgi:tetratricopeptide (TPR) repeat protein